MIFRHFAIAGLLVAAALSYAQSPAQWQRSYSFFPPSCCVMGQTVDLRDLRGQPFIFALTPPKKKVFTVLQSSGRIITPQGRWIYNLSFTGAPSGAINIAIQPVMTGSRDEPSVWFTPDYGAGGTIGIRYSSSGGRGGFGGASGFIIFGSEKTK